MENYRFAGYRVIQFPKESKVALAEIAERLIPHEKEIIDRWITLQFTAWQPPGLDKKQLKQLFGNLLHNMLACMSNGKLEDSISDLEIAGAQLARSNFPYEALIVSLHFLEESYIPFLLNPHSERTQDWLIRIDEFLHVGIAALATSYFDFYREQLLTEAEIGRVVQEALFPHPSRKIDNLEVGFIYASASEKARLGGDFLDVFPFGKNGAAFVVGDLSGHGLSAAADSSAIRNLFKGFMRDKANLADAMNRLNKVLAEDLEDNQFATALAGIYEPSGRLMLANAGNPLPIIGRNDSHFVEHIGLPLGVNEQETYKQVEVELKPNDVFVAYTDGLSDARVGGNLFGEDRVLEIVHEMRDTPARAIAEHLKDQAIRHANGKLLDDMAILVLRRLDGK